MKKLFFLVLFLGVWGLSFGAADYNIWCTAEIVDGNRMPLYGAYATVVSGSVDGIRAYVEDDKLMVIITKTGIYSIEVSKDGYSNRIVTILTGNHDDGDIVVFSPVYLYPISQAFFDVENIF